MKNKKNNELELLNFEGPVLKASRVIDSGTLDVEFVIHDQHDSLVSILTRAQLFEFFDGTLDLVDSDGKSWNYTKYDRGAKPSMCSIYEFVKPLDI